MGNATIATTPGHPRILTIRLSPYGIDMVVRVSRDALKTALCASDTYWGLSAEVLAKIDAVEDAALFKYARTGTTELTLSAAELIVFTQGTGSQLQALMQ